MMSSTIRRTLTAVLLALAATAAVAAPPPLKNVSEPEAGVLSAGQPTAEQLQELARTGYKTVIDLRGAQEDRGFDEAKVAREAGLAYVNVPVSPQALDTTAIDAFMAALRTAERPVLLHCATAGRSGGMIYAWLVLEKGVAPEEALKQARAAGLHNPELEEKVVSIVGQEVKRRHTP